MIRERQITALPGLPMLLLLLAADAAAQSYWLDRGGTGRLRWAGHRSQHRRPGRRHVPAGGAVRRQPERSQGAAVFRRLRRLGDKPGLRWANPFYTKKRVSQRVRNFESAKLKVNDNEGNPIEIASVVVWRVVDTAEAVFEVDDYNNYVKVQSESALRNLAHELHLRCARRHHDLAARHDAGRGRSSEEGDPGSAVACGCRGHGSAHQPSRLCAGDRARDAAAAAGRRHHRRSPADRRGRGRDGGNGAGDALQARDRRRSTTSAGRRW